MLPYIDKVKNTSIKNELIASKVDKIIKEINSFLPNKKIEELVIDKAHLNWLRNVLFCEINILLEDIKRSNKNE